MGRYAAIGDTERAIGYFRAAVYRDFASDDAATSVNGPEDKGYNETHSDKLMEFALLLLKAGHRVEALDVYRHGYAHVPTDRGPLPPLFATPDFAPADFQAAAYTAMGLWTTAWSDPNGGEADFERAIATQPTMAAPYFYRGLILKGAPGRAADALAAFAQAERLGGPEMKPFADKERKTGSGEFLVAVKKAQSDATP